ncbi:MAG TPA: DUF4136 domain-containing protein [Candidatus Polarisedimenticolaceae bacterium]|nr:DUF4136 domain-containing protein [Candidatus Polarisedimenticolaceae bacterium]
MSPHPAGRGLTVLVAACAWCAGLAGDVEVEVGRDADLSAYATYSWKGGEPPADDWARLTIVEAVDRELASRGLSKVATGGDLSVSALALAESVTGTTVDPGYWGGGTDFGMPSVDIADYRKGSLYVTVEDRAAGRVVWKASGKANIEMGTQDKFADKIESVVSRVFRKFPRRAR